MSATGALGMERMNRSVLKSRNRILDKAAFVKRVGMNHGLHVERIRHRKATVNAGWRRSPVFVQLECTGACQHLFFQRCRE